jgi:acyl-CoA synthetase (AMP-forming)/AMP-acid ligase II
VFASRVRKGVYRCAAVAGEQVRDQLGGQVRYLGSGASPLSKDVFDFLRICFGAKVLEGYGMTETSIAITCTDEDDLMVRFLSCVPSSPSFLAPLAYESTERPNTYSDRACGRPRAML